ncbi:hydrogenase maturation nickel metallochaperone HypA [Kitasatospora sp. NPDC048540]|uniref:hydrogenase maturation nickel metallochaperone HypA n=1 Tax=unclassified Kitasatospora TaxID=2633591 RepID=UPI00053B5476|nr:hydrogenase maturation nickel metallochaperone HypA [Kitasatospora sp. MBT63]
MHEMSIAQAIVDQVEASSEARAGSTAHQVNLQVGELAGVVPDALRFGFDLVCEGTVLAGAELRIEPVPALAECGPCGTGWAPGMPPDLVCPTCGSGTGTELVSGRELQITAVHWSGGDIRVPRAEEL